jgi:diguanylate cyclase (GGDEF)-like protein/PAS domain S-box-containing protein
MVSWIRALPILGLSLVCALLVAACAQPQAAAPREPEQVTLQLKWQHQFQFAGYYAAIAQGYYREAGLEVTLLEAPPEVEPAQVVLEGGADFGIASSDLVLLRSQGKPVVALAAIYQHSPFVFLASRAAGIDSVHDLAGRPVMIEPHAAELLAYLQFEGVSGGGVIQVPHSVDPMALIRGQVDAVSAYSTDEPFLLDQAGLEYITLNPRAGGIDFYGDTLFTTEAQIRQHPERVRAFLDASLRGWQYALDHPDEMVELIYTQYSQRHSREHLAYEAEHTERLILPEVVEIGYMNPGRWRHIADVYAEMNMAPPGVSLEGFMYEPNPRPNLTWLYLSLTGALGVLAVVTFTAARFYKLNTDIRREMAERARVEGHLRTLEKRYRILAENAPFPILISHMVEGAILYMNPKAAEQFAVTQDEVVGQPTEAFYQEPADRADLLADLNGQGFVQNREVRLRRADQSGFWASLSATVITFEEQPAIFVSLIDLSDRKALEARLESLAMTDALTGLYNRRYFSERGVEEFHRAQRYQSHLSVLMLDMDELKGINDQYGHAAGDAVLRLVTAALKNNLREVDIPGRLGGDEFGVLLPDTTLEGAQLVAERLRAAIEGQFVSVADQSVHTTASLGAAEFGAGMASFDELVRQADSALYAAKSAGRNRVCLAAAPAAEPTT